MADTSKKQLLDFLQWAGEKGMMKKATARSNKAACNTVLSVLSEEEEADVLAIDLSSVFSRYENLHTMDVSPSTMRSYRQRVNYAIEEFRRYNENRSGWKPSGGQRKISENSLSKRAASANSAVSTNSPDSIHSSDDAPDVSKIVHQFPLRRDIVVTVSGIPFDVKKGEMGRLTAFLANLVADQEDARESMAALNPSSEEGK